MSVRRRRGIAARRRAASLVAVRASCRVAPAFATLAVAALTIVVGSTDASAAVQADGYRAGPVVIGGGLLWAGGYAGREGVFLSSSSASRLLAPDAQLPAVSVTNGWVVFAGASGPKAARIGHPLRVVPGLRGCRPIRASRQPIDGYGESWPVQAVANGSIYAVVRPSCLGRRSRHSEMLVRVRLRDGNLRVIGRVPSGAVSLAAARSRVALTYPTGMRVRVEVLDARTAHRLYRVSAPPRQADYRSYSETQLDAQGDVLVTGRGRRST